LSQSVTDILVVGGVGGTNVGDSLHRAAMKLGLDSTILDSRTANAAPAWLRRFSWHLLGRRPVHLSSFSQQVLDHCREKQPDVLITTGLAPVTAKVLEEVGRLGIRRLNFLTDDPWNKAHRAGWFMKALPVYDEVYSPRLAMIDDLHASGCGKVEYLPFGYDPDLFFPEMAENCNAGGGQRSDVVFAGGADDDRVPYMAGLIEAGFNLELYGDYWHRQSVTKRVSRGQADVHTLRCALTATRVGLCLVRRANRDGSCMRTFEVPAVGACMLTEDTDEHRAIFGGEGDAVLYFDSLESMIEKTRLLCRDDDLRLRLADRAHRLITEGGHRYQDRLVSMLKGEGWRQA